MTNASGSEISAKRFVSNVIWGLMRQIHNIQRDLAYACISFVHAADIKMESVVVHILSKHAEDREL
jgi:hypothetical protein